MLLKLILKLIKRIKMWNKLYSIVSSQSAYYRGLSSGIEKEETLRMFEIRHECYANITRLMDDIEREIKE